MRVQALAVLVAGLLGTSAGAGESTDPLTRPITGAAAARWLEPDRPVQVFGNTAYVGPKRVKQVVIDTGQGLVLIDAGLPEGLPALRAQLAQFGYSLGQVRWVLVSEPHYDHAGALAAVLRESGATVFASASTARALARGISGADDPQRAHLIAFAPVRAARTVQDGARLRLGGVTVTARAMPGHTPGSMGWSWQTCEASDCARVFFAASLNPLTAGGYRYSQHPALVADFRRSLAMLEQQPCDILLSNHAEHSGADARLAARLAGTQPNPMRNAGACRAMAEKYRKALDEELAHEAAQRP